MSHIYVWYQEARERNAWGLNPSSFDDHKRGCNLKVIKRNHRKYIDVDDLKKSFQTDSRKKNIKMEKRMTQKSENDEDEACGDLKKFKQI